MDFVPFTKYFDVAHWIVVKKNLAIYFIFMSKMIRNSPEEPIDTCLPFLCTNSNYFVSRGDKSQAS